MSADAKPNDWNQPVDALLTRWATAGREVDVPPGAALAAADRALGAARGVSAAPKRWFPAAVFGGSMAAAVAGVLLLAPASDPAAPVTGAPQLAEAEPDPRLPLPVQEGGTQMAGLAEEFPQFDGPTDDLFMTSHVFTTRPEEELIY